MKVETSLSGQRRRWPVYREITRQERAERASEELLERQHSQEQEEVRKFQRQNDKFIGREPKVRFSYTSSDLSASLPGCETVSRFDDVHVMRPNQINLQNNLPS